MIEHINTVDVSKVGSGEINRLIRLPKNIRQIGQADAEKRIYIEDYVVTFIRQRGKDKRYVLVGSSGMVGDVYAVFISGAIIIEDEWNEGNSSSGFTSKAWEMIYKEIKEAFPQLDIVGWAYATDDWEDIDNNILKTHITNFPGEDKVLYAVDTYSREEYMYKYHLGALRKQKGYYMYYEKNEQMQAYMLKVNKPKSNEASYKDETTQKIRTIALKGYAPENEEKEKPKSEKSNVVMTTILAVAMLALAFKISVDGAELFSKSNNENYQTVGQQSVAGDNKETTDAEDEEEHIVEMTLPPEAVVDKEAQENKSTLAPNPTKKPKETKKPQVTKKPVAEDKTSDSKKPDGEKKEDGSNSETVVSTVDKPTSYIVKDGDTLAGISYKMYGTMFKVEEIMKANSISDKNVIVVGQKLVIPR